MTASEAYNNQKIRFTLWLEKHDRIDSNPIRERDIDLDQLLQLCVSKDVKSNLALHAIWFLEKYALAHTARLPYIFDFLVANLASVSIEGAQRILGNIFLQALKNLPQNTATEGQEEALINCGFDWLTTPGKSIAVVANSFDLLYILSLRHAWIKEPLEAEISLLLERGTTPAIRSRGQKIVKQLHKMPKKK
ncbi:hypothetical protein M8998_02345 [Sphingobacterium sp. lm-10]|uniref:hypothetical protein n=1 Tax=Sphingobacterium sp. lm-10 TaxID=2944904 RepID=UPI0020224809|nr:hypothetical protein [Sphingobacterium sp. lm-10]MCL7986773.1 hypothetical protein [Sphingobacterium sp. lm-10]